MEVLHSARVVRQPADGSCLFHSLAHGLKDGCNAHALRRQTAAFIESHPGMEISDSPLRDWVMWDSGASVGAYSRRMMSGESRHLNPALSAAISAAPRLPSRPHLGRISASPVAGGTWGGGIEMAVVAALKRVSVHVYQQTHSASGRAFKRISCFSGPPGCEKIVRVLYCGGVHYDALEVSPRRAAI